MTKKYFINSVYSNLPADAHYVTFNKHFYYFYKKKINIKLLKSNLNKYSYINRSINLLNSKLKRYRKEISVKICSSNDANYLHQNYNWGLILDTWLLTVLSKVVYETDILEKIKKKKIKFFYKKSKKIFLYKESWDVMRDIAESHDFNIFFLNLLLDKQKKINKNLLIKKYKKNEHNFFRYFYLEIIKILINIYIIIRKPILFTNSYYNTFSKIKLFLLSFGLIIFKSNLRSLLIFSSDSSKFDFSLRRKLKIVEEDKYDKNFNKVLPYLFPQNFLENFLNLIKNKDFFNKNLKLIGTGTELHSSDEYKVIAANKCIKINNIIFQHGGLYNIQKKNIIESIEKKYSKFFYAWNNKIGIGLNGILSIARTNNSLISKSKEICLFTTYNIYYFGRFQYFFPPENYRDEFKENLNFYLNLNNDIKKCFVLRLFKIDPTLNLISRWKKYLKKNQFDKENKSFNKFSKIRIFVTDHISTPFFEALYSGVPIIVYCDYNSYGFKDEFKNLLDKAKKNKIIFDSPKSASEFVNLNYDNILLWWNSDEIQNLLKEIKKYLFKYNNNYYKVLITDLKKHI